MIENLQITHNTELQILLAAAEKMKSGIYTAVEGDPTQEAESVIELFSEF